MTFLLVDYTTVIELTGQRIWIIDKALCVGGNAAVFRKEFATEAEAKTALDNIVYGIRNKRSVVEI